MLSSTLPLLPPPSASLLPSLSPDQPVHTPHSSNQPHLPHRRIKPAIRPSSLAALTLDERAITQRKLAIAMYGWSWLKPVGCAKTMLGRKEEEIEREEVERQLREVELQEQMQLQAEEAERTRMQAGQREAEQRGEPVGAEQRDLDEDVPDMDAAEGEEEDDDDDDDEADLDDEIPDADMEYPEFIYDTRREPDTDSDDQEVEGETEITDDLAHSHLHSDSHNAQTTRLRQNIGPLPYDTQREAEALARDMLDEDELGEAERDLDDEIPDADGRVGDPDHDEPDANDEGEWQHTDTELEESEMDISLLPAQQAHIQTRSQARQRTSDVRAGNAIPMQTPVTAESSSAGHRRSWLGVASPRRNLFGRGNREASNAEGSRGSLFGTWSTPPQSADQPEEARRVGRRGTGVGRSRRVDDTENRDDVD